MLRQDLRYALRTARQTPGFTLAAVAALTLGIGVNTAIFSVINAVLLSPLPYPDPGGLIAFTTTFAQGSAPVASPTKFNVWREQTDVFRNVSALRFSAINLTGDNPEQIVAGVVSADFFRLFGAPLIAGRTFTPDEDRPNGGHVVVLSEGFWKRRFASDRGIVGRTVRLGDEAYDVIGVLGRFDTDTFSSPTGPPDVWLPFQLDANSVFQGHYFLAVGRLAPGVTPGAATARLQRVAREFRQRYPDAMDPTNSFGYETLQDVSVRGVRSTLWILAGAVGFVLLIACANVANLLLIRATARKQEIAVRAALGAHRGRIVRQLLTESIVLSLAGGALGLVLGSIGIRALIAINPGNIPRIGTGSAVTIDWRVFVFTAIVSVMTGLLFGLVPSLHATRADLHGTLKESTARTGPGFRQQRVRSLLVISEIALALVLLVGSALFIRTFMALRAVNPGFATHNVLTMSMSLSGTRFADPAVVEQLIRDGAERLRALPGVEAAAASCCVPLQGGFGLPFNIEGRPLHGGPYHGAGGFTPISPTYLATFKIPIVRGREFNERDVSGAQPVVIINQAMAKQFWPDGDPLSDRLTIGKGMGPTIEQPSRQIVGIAGDVRDQALNFDPQPAMYVPWAQLPRAESSSAEIAPLVWVVRTSVDPQRMTAAIADAVRQASGGMPVARPRTMDEVVVRSTARHDFNMSLMTIFAAAALLLAAVGVYGLMAYAVEQRTQEIGIRLTLGADARDVRNMVLRQGMSVALVGVALGVLAAFGLTRVVASALYGVTSRDPVVFVSAPIILSAIALLGVWLPARRAARVAPAVALRME